MALLIKVGEFSDFPPLPADFPRCGGMGYSNARRKPPGGAGSCPTGSATVAALCPAATFLAPAFWIFAVFLLFGAV
ncbi:hypothetical protein ACOMHN_029042 [Nucella lapillus]